MTKVKVDLNNYFISSWCIIEFNGIANFYIISANLLTGKFTGSSLILLFEKEHCNFLERETRILFCFRSYKVALLRLDTLDLMPNWVIPSTDSTTVQYQLKIRTHLHQSSQRCYIIGVIDIPTHNSKNVGFVLVMAKV